MMVVIIHPDPHEARRLALQAKHTLGPGLVIITAGTPSEAASLLGDLSGEKDVPILSQDAPALARGANHLRSDGNDRSRAR